MIAVTQYMSVNRILWQIVVYALLIAGSIVMLFPFFWMVSTSLKAQWQVFTIPVKWLPDPVMWENYVTTFSRLPFGQWTLNTLKITAFGILGTLLSCTVVAYGFARYKAPGRNFLFIVMLSTMMLPGTVTMIPTFYLFKLFNWMNTYYPLIVPHYFGSAFFIFLLRQFFMTIPPEIEESARIDGASTLGILWRIMVPLTVPALITVAIFQFNGLWNDFMGPLIYLNKPSLYTLALGINFFKSSERDTQWNYLMAASVVAMLPSLLFFFVGQKYFVQSITLTGLKG